MFKILPIPKIRRISPLILSGTISILAGCNSNPPQQTSIDTHNNASYTQAPMVTVADPQRGVEPYISPRNGSSIQSRRRALVIGNSTYNKMPQWKPLPNPVNDATDMATALTKLGFQVTTLRNATLTVMDNEIHRFGLDTQPTDIVLFYYAGHGMQVKGENFLLPIDANFEREDQIERTTIKASVILSKIGRATTKIVFLDACRFNPFADRGVRAGTFRGGLAKMKTSDGTLLVYSTAPDKFAADSVVGSRNSPFTQSLLRHIGTPGVDAQIMLRKVRVDVKRMTRGSQTPWEASSLEGSFYFVPVNSTVVSNTPAAKDPEVARLKAQLAKEKAQKEATARRLAEEKRQREAAELQAQRVKAEADRKLAAEKRQREEAERKAQLARQAAERARQQQVVQPPPPPRRSFEPAMVSIPAGSFKMGDIQGGGDSDENPVHEVYIKAFKISKHEITVGQYMACVRDGGCKPPEWQEKGSKYNAKTGSDDHYRKLGSALTNSNHPIVGVSWNDGVDYAKWLSRKTGKKYRLPTEAEWEYVARAGTSTKYWWGNEIGHNRANCRGDYCGDSYQYTSPVGSFAANPWGVYDTAGNVREWTCSQYTSSYDGSEMKCLLSGASARVFRGGSWSNNAVLVRAASRLWNEPGSQSFNVGFRACEVQVK